MVKKQNIRKTLNQIRELTEKMSLGISMDTEMDGSGECGEFVVRGWTSWFNRELNRVLSDNGVTLSEVQQTADTWAKKELEMGPKQVFISMWSRRDGMYKEVDYFDTKWGSLSYSIHNSLDF